MPLRLKAGDGTRTRDSLLGRQDAAKLPLGCFRPAREADRRGTCVLYAASRKEVTVSCDKISRSLPDFITRFRQKISCPSSGRRSRTRPLTYSTRFPSRRQDFRKEVLLLPYRPDLLNRPPDDRAYHLPFNWRHQDTILLN